MADTVTINLRHVARGIGIPLQQVQAVVELLDDGNTVPFITRYRKDQTGGLDEEQIRQIQDRLTKMRLLADRKQTILRSIELQGKLTEALAQQIQAATTTKRLEDLYLPYKPKKQTLATTARSRGLEPLAMEILRAAPSCANLDARAADYINPDRQIPTAADALLGAGHILAEEFSERAELRHKLREILQRTGRLVCTQIGPEPKAEPAKPTRAEASAVAEPAPAVAEPQDQEPETPPLPEQPLEPPVFSTAEQPVEPVAEAASDPPDPVPPPDEGDPDDPIGSGQGGGDGEEPPPGPIAGQSPAEQPFEPALVAAGVDGPELAAVPQPTLQEQDASASGPATGPAPGLSPPVAGPETESSPAASQSEPSPAPGKPAARRPKGPAKPQNRHAKATERRAKREQKKKREDEKKQKAFSDYYDYQEEIRKIPPHRVLALNRGERAKVLRAKIEVDLEAMYRMLEEECIPPDHPHADILRGCARDALTRLILPSLEREMRRELTDRAETHAVEVFAKNLRKLLLQPPIRGRRVLAVDPGFKSGCKLVALDQFGNVLEHGVIYLVGNAERRQKGREKVADLVERFGLSVVAVGNGTACREAEDFFAELIGGELKDKDVRYVIVNEAGASVYSTSRLGREEFPNYDAILRGAISIGRRLQDPLSELVKIDPASIGVGLYQHDVKAKHLQTSLDDVVQSCVNYVGVDVNTASPSLLRYVSGLNQLTARRVYEHRMAHGPFRSRRQLKEVPGFGEATFVQSAGFLKISDGDNPLDATWIHPESYEIAVKVLERLECTPEDLAKKEIGNKLSERIGKLSPAELSQQVGAGSRLLADILAQLARPGRDPREDLPAPVFKQGVLKLEDLNAGMELTGTVLNVVDFGAFVDIGMHDSGLVHVSQMADKFVRDPHEVLAVGDVVRVWVVKVDKERRRVSLTMVPPRKEPPPPPRREARPAEGPRPARGPQPQGPPRGGRPQGRGGPPPRGKARPAPRPAQYKPKPQPKPLKPLSEGMKQGAEPLRTFGDLLQFYQLKQKGPDDGQKPTEVKDRGKDEPKPVQDKPQEPPA
jgi:uncharacterized protein